MNIQLLSQISILMPILVIFFGGAEPTKRLPKRAINNTANNETGSPGNAKNEKNADVIDEVALKRFVLEYETELKKELERRKLETGKEARKVKREDFQPEIEEFEDPILKYKSYRILRKIRSPERTQLVNPEDLITQFQNEGKKFLQNAKESSAAVGLDIIRKLEALQDSARKELLPNGTNSKYSDRHKDNEDIPDNYVGIAADTINVTLAGFNKAPVVKISKHDVGDGSLSSFKLEGYRTSSMKGSDSLVKAAYVKEDNANEDRPKEEYAKDDDAYKDNEDKESDSKEDAKKTNDKENDAKEDGDREGDAKEGDATEDYAKEGDSKEDATKTNAKEKDDGEGEAKESDAKEGDAKEDNAKEDDTEGSDNKVGDKIKLIRPNDFTEDKLREGGFVSTTDKKDRGIHHQDDKDLALDMWTTTPSSNGIGHRRAKRNAKKDEPETKFKEKKNGTKKRKVKDNVIKEGKMECSLTEEKYDEENNGTERSDKEKDLTREPVKEEVMSDIEDVKEGTDYEESQS